MAKIRDLLAETDDLPTQKPFAWKNTDFPALTEKDAEALCKKNMECTLTSDSKKKNKRKKENKKKIS